MSGVRDADALTSSSPIDAGCSCKVLHGPLPMYGAAHADCRALWGGTQTSVEASLSEFHWGFEEGAPVASGWLEQSVSWWWMSWPFIEFRGKKHLLCWPLTFGLTPLSTVPCFVFSFSLCTAVYLISFQKLPLEAFLGGFSQGLVLFLNRGNKRKPGRYILLAYAPALGDFFLF